MLELKDRWVVITGASRGVGRQIALGLADRPVRFVLHARSEAHLGSIAEELRARGREVWCEAADLADERAVDALVDRVLARSGGVDVLYNNAAIMTPWREPHTTPMDDYRLSFAVNVLALVRLCDRFLPAMLARRWGRIVNVTSGIENIRELLPYSLSKAAVDRYVRDVSPSLAGTGVVMSLLDPGWLRTDLGGPSAPDPVEHALPGALVPALVEDGTPSGRLYRAQELRTAADQVQ
jgi:3-oxoacyl-[acyl-carrier protein] reductase